MTKNEPLVHWEGTNKTEFVTTTNRTSPKTFTNNLWLAINDMHSELVSCGIPFKEIEKFMREEMSLNLKVAKKQCLKIWEDDKKK